MVWETIILRTRSIARTETLALFTALKFFKDSISRFLIFSNSLSIIKRTQNTGNYLEMNKLTQELYNRVSDRIKEQN